MQVSLGQPAHPQMEQLGTLGQADHRLLDPHAHAQFIHRTKAVVGHASLPHRHHAVQQFARPVVIPLGHLPIGDHRRRLDSLEVLLVSNLHVVVVADDRAVGVGDPNVLARREPHARIVPHVRHVVRFLHHHVAPHVFPLEQAHPQFLLHPLAERMLRPERQLAELIQFVQRRLGRVDQHQRLAPPKRIEPLPLADPPLLLRQGGDLRHLLGQPPDHVPVRRRKPRCALARLRRLRRSRGGEGLPQFNQRAVRQSHVRIDPVRLSVIFHARRRRPRSRGTNVEDKLFYVPQLYRRLLRRIAQPHRRAGPERFAVRLHAEDKLGQFRLVADDRVVVKSDLRAKLAHRLIAHQADFAVRMRAEPPGENLPRDLQWQPDVRYAHSQRRPTTLADGDDVYGMLGHDFPFRGHSEPG